MKMGRRGEGTEERRESEKEEAKEGGRWEREEVEGGRESKVHCFRVIPIVLSASSHPRVILYSFSLQWLT